MNFFLLMYLLIFVITLKMITYGIATRCFEFAAYSRTSISCDVLKTVCSEHGFLLPLKIVRQNNFWGKGLEDKMSGSRFLFSNGILSHTIDTPSVKIFLETHTGTVLHNTFKIIIFLMSLVFWKLIWLASGPGAYTTTRTHNIASCLLFWERHMKRLTESIQILSNVAPELLLKSNKSAALLPSSATLPVWQPIVQMLVNHSLCKVLPIALNERIGCEEMAITTLVSGDLEELNASETMDEKRARKVFNVHVHVETYVPPAFGIRGNGAHLAVVGFGRHVAAAKYSDWVRLVHAM